MCHIDMVGGAKFKIESLSFDYLKCIFSDAIKLCVNMTSQLCCPSFATKIQWATTLSQYDSSLSNTRKQ